MSVKVVVELTVKPESIEPLKTMWRGILGDTRAFEGCIDIFIYQNQDEPANFMLIETWESRPQYDKYLAWRVETGFVENLSAHVVGDPRFSFYDLTDI